MYRTKVDESVMLSLVVAYVSLSGLHCCLSVTHAKNSDSITTCSYSKSDTIAKNSDSITTCELITFFVLYIGLKHNEYLCQSLINKVNNVFDTQITNYEISFGKKLEHRVISINHSKGFWSFASPSIVNYIINDSLSIIN